jgi:hypothetical protein
VCLVLGTYRVINSTCKTNNDHLMRYRYGVSICFPNLMGIPHFSHDLWVSVTLVARLPLLPVALNLCAWEQGVFILEHYFASKPSAAVREAFSNAYPDGEVLNTTTELTSSVRLHMPLYIELSFKLHILYIDCNWMWGSRSNIETCKQQETKNNYVLC